MIDCVELMKEEVSGARMNRKKGARLEKTRRKEKQV